MTAQQALTGFRAPDEDGAQQRAWDVVRHSYLEREPARRARRAGRPVLAFALALAAGALALSPAGAAVGRLVGRALGVPHAARALSSLPTPGRLLISGPAGAWTVAADGSTRRIGPWTQASWSPHALYAAVVRGDRLVAINPLGRPQWTLARPALIDPRWYPPSGYRVAYLSGDQLRVVAGDGTGDHVVAAGVARLAPAWRPGHPYELAYATRAGTLVLRDADSRRTIWSTRSGAGVEQLSWSPDGQRLIAVSRTSVHVFEPSRRAGRAVTLPVAGRVIASSLSPDGRELALVQGGGAPMRTVVIERLGAHATPSRRILSGIDLREIDWSPDGRWLLISWPAANQWVFARVVGAPRIAAVSRITQTFAAGSSGAFPALDGWCCSTRRALR